MIATLNVSPKFTLPLEWMTLATVVYGARGSGKTTFGSVAAEEVTRARQRFCAIDLKGDWYGLKSTADGKGEGIDVIVFGGDHQDVPLEEDAGAFLGETVANLSHSCILDFEYMSKGKQVRFLASFFETLYHRNRDPLLLLLDEAQRYAPQKPMSPDEARCLGAVQDTVKLGRKHGLGVVIFTQRGAGLNKEVSELCDMLVAFRTPGPLDQDRIKDWLDANTSRAQRDDVMGQLSGLPTGTAIFASGHPDLKLFGQYPVRQRETFDSSATPRVGQRRQEPKKLATPDLAELRAKMAAAIERQKADDPKELRAQIAKLERQLESCPITEPEERVVEIPALTAAQTGELERLRESMPVIELQVQTLQETLDRTLTELAQMVTVIDRLSVAPRLRHEVEVPARTSAPKSQKTKAEKPKPEKLKTGRTPVDGAEPKLKRGERAMLDTLKAFGGRLSRTQLGTMVRIRPKGTTMGVYLSTLRRNGLIVDVDDETVELTRQGRQRAKKVPVITAGELTQMWSSRLKAGERKLLDAIIRSGARGIDKTSLAKMANIDEEGTTLGVYLSTLRRNSLVREISKRFYPGDALSLAQSQASEAS